MTVGLLLLPDGLTTIISDALVTSGERSPTFGPDAYKAPDDLASQPATLVSKVLRIDERSAVCFAGQEQLILQTLEDVRSRYSISRGVEAARPLRYVGDLMNEINDNHRDPYAISSLGFSVPDDLTIPLRPLVREKHHIVSRNFQSCYAIGSGAEAMLRFIEEFDRSFKHEEPGPADAALWCFLGSLNSLEFFRPQPRKTWGGFYSAHVFHWGRQEFLDTPDWVYLRFQIDLDQSPPKVQLVGKLVISLQRSTKTLLQLYLPLEHGGPCHQTWSMNSSLNIRSSAPSFDVNDFDPKLATVMFTFKRGDQKVDRITTLSGTHLEHLRFRSFHDNTWEFGLTEEYVEVIVSEGLSRAVL